MTVGYSEAAVTETPLDYATEVKRKASELILEAERECLVTTVPHKHSVVP